MPQSLAPDSTLASITATLVDPIEFVRGAFETMWAVQKTCGPVVMRLGVTGTGKYPNYRLDEEASGAVVKAYDGGNHKPWPPGSEIIDGPTWSTGSMTTTEVQLLLKALRDKAKA